MATVVSYVGPEVDNLGDGATFNFSVDTGVASSDRSVLVGIIGQGGAFSSATIGGVPATVIDTGNGTDNDFVWLHASLPNNDGLQTVDVTVASAWFYTVAHTWVLRGANPTPTAFASEIDETYPYDPATSVAVDTGGAVFSIAAANSGAGPTFSGTSALNTTGPTTASILDHYALDAGDLQAGTFDTAQDGALAFIMGTVSFAPDGLGGGATLGMAAQESGADTAAASASVGNATVLSVQETPSDTATGSISTTSGAALTAQESGADTAAGAANSIASAALTAQESGADTATATTSATATTFATTQESGADSMSATLVVSSDTISAALGAQESGVDTISGAATVAVAVSGVAQEQGTDTATAVAGVPVASTGAAQETGVDQTAFDADVPVSAALVAQETGADESSMWVSFRDTLNAVKTVAITVTTPDQRRAVAATIVRQITAKTNSRGLTTNVG